MSLNKISFEEMMLLQLLSLQSLQPHYWSELIALAENLMDDEERLRLNEMIFEVERMVLETEVVPKQEEGKRLVWVERIKGELSLYDVEMAFESNSDFYAFFQKDDGTIVTKFDVERRLDKIRKYIYGVVRKRSQGRRFTRMR